MQGKLWSFCHRIVVAFLQKWLDPYNLAQFYFYGTNGSSAQMDTAVKIHCINEDICTCLYNMIRLYLILVRVLLLSI